MLNRHLRLSKWGISLLLVAMIMLLKDDGMKPREKHQYFLSHSPYKISKHLKKSDRLAQGLPANLYNEEIYELTMDPNTGSPNYASKLQTQSIMKLRSSLRRGAVPGQDSSTPWYTIGPNNEAGRSRAALFDLADPEKDRVIAGGVSGGLWENTDITDPARSWNRISGVPGNLAVSVIVQDPTDTNVMFVGTGESYTNGDVTGNGIYRSNDGGVSWNFIFGSSTGLSTTTLAGGFYDVDGYFYVNDLAIWDHDDNPATQEYIYAALGTSMHSKMASTYLDDLVYGLYVSTDGGGEWNPVTINSSLGKPEHINDIEVQTISNRLWLSTNSNPAWGIDGGNFYFSDDGLNYTKVSPSWVSTPTNVKRTEIAPSSTNTDTHYILTSTNSNNADLYKTTDNFATIQNLNEPVDDEDGMPATDFTRGQAFYDLEIEVDPTDDNIVYAGGINWHRSDDGGNSWEQISIWNDSDLWFANLYNQVSVVHADQHGLYFRPGNSDEAVVVSDGGVSYTTSLSAATNTLTFSDRENNFVTTQFYRVAQTPPNFAGSDGVFGGTQDNGTYQLINPSQSLTNATSVSGGDGAATFFDQIGGDYMISNYVFNNSITRFDYDNSGNREGPFYGVDLSVSLTIPDNEGSFINPAALDSYNDIYFSNAGENIRVITDLDGTPATFTIDGVVTSPNYLTTLEVSRHTTNTTTLFIGTRNGEVMKITNAGINGGATITTLFSRTGSVSDIHIGESEDDLFVTYYNYGINSNVLYSSDGGDTQENKEGNLPDIPVYSILHNPYEATEVIIGTELGVWRTDNFDDPNPNWSVADDGMSDVAVKDMVFRGPSATDNRVVAATYGRGIYVGSFSSNSNPPISRTDSITVDEGGTATTTTGGANSVLDNDSDPDADVITTGNVTTTVNGTFIFAPSGVGTFTYTHDGSETTTDVLYYNAFDNTNYGNTVSVTITITPVPDCPTVQTPIGNQTASEDDPDDIIDFTNTFFDPDTLNLSYTVSNTNPTLLSATASGTTIIIDYADNQSGIATITLSANDTNCGSITEEVFRINVSEQNDPPVGVQDSISVVEGETATTTTGGATSLLSNDTDQENDTLLTSNVVVPPTNGILTLANTGVGTFTYVHDGSETVTDLFIYELYDGENFGNNVTVTINIIPDFDCPEIQNPIADLSAIEDDPNDVVDFSTTFFDPDSLSLSYTVSNTTPSLLSATISGTTIIIDYVSNQTGVATITLSANDSSCGSIINEIFVVNVLQVNDPPVGIQDSFSVEEGGTLDTRSIAASSVLINDSDPEGISKNSSKLTDPNFGTLIMDTEGGFEYVHDGSESASDTFNYTLTDSVNNVTVSVTINIIAVNDCPTIENPIDNIVVDEGSPNQVIDLASVFSDVDIYPTPNVLSYIVTYTNTNIATLTLDTASLTIDFNDITGGSSVVSITAFDGTCSETESFNILINSINDIPITVEDFIEVDEGDSVMITTVGNSSLLDNDSDIDGPSTLKTANVSMPSYGTLNVSSPTGTFLYVHDGSETSSDSFSYAAYDGEDFGNTVSVTISINPINDCPENNKVYNDTVNEDDINYCPTGCDNLVGQTYSIGSSDTIDVDNSYPLVSYTVTYTNASLATVTFDPGVGDPSFELRPHEFGTMVGTVTINDGLCEIKIPFQLNVNAVNDCPTLDNPISDITADEDDPNLIIDISETFSDVDDLVLNYSTVSDNPTMISPSVTGTALTIDFLPNQNGSAVLIFTAADGDPFCTVDDAIRVTVNSINDPPTSLGDQISIQSGNTVTSLTDGSVSVLANDSDPENNDLDAILVNDVVNGTLTLSTDGSFIYTHDNSLTTTDSFSYYATDGGLNGNTVVVNIFINNPPVGVPETIAVIESGSANTTTAGATSVLTNDTDTDIGDQANLSAVKITNPQHGTLTLNSDGSFLYQHNGNNQASDSFTYSPNDGKINGDPVTVSITVSGTNDPPVAYNDVIIVPIGETITTLDNGTNSIAFNDIDPDGDAFTVVQLSAPTYGTLVLNPGGTFSYSQNGVINAGDSFTYKINDGNLDSNSATVDIYLSCEPCIESVIEGGNNGVSLSYTDCDCKTVRVYIPKGKAFSFCHLENSIITDAGNYIQLSQTTCR